MTTATLRLNICVSQAEALNRHYVHAHVLHVQRNVQSNSIQLLGQNLMKNKKKNQPQTLETHRSSKLLILNINLRKDV